MKLEHAALTDTGLVRDHNEDNFGFCVPENGRALFVVADGMGGHRGGETASKLAVDTVTELFCQSENRDTREILTEAFASANRIIVDSSVADAMLFGMGTTCTALALSKGEAWFAHVGDSRAYRIRDGEIVQITDDHSLVGEMVRSGIITDDDARSHPKRNVITRSLGSHQVVITDTPESPMQLMAGDTLLLCSDGLTSHVSDEEIRDAAGSGPLEDACRTLIDMANARGGRDNITVQIVRVIEP